MSAIVVVTSDPAITVTQDNPAVTAVVPVTQFATNKAGFSLSTPIAASSDFNTLTAAGFFHTVDVLSTNTPVASHLWYLNVDVDGGNPLYVRQLATMLDVAGTTYLRTLINGAWGSWQGIVALDGAGRLPAVDGSLLTNVNAGVSIKIQNYISGLALSTAGSTALFSVAAGVANDSTNTATMVLAGALAKTTNSWSAGNGNGALDTGSIANSTWYHVYLIENPTTLAIDVLISLSATTPAPPTGFTLFRRIGAMKTSGSAQWTKFIQVDGRFFWDVPVNDVSAYVATTSQVSKVLSVPTGIIVQAMLKVAVTNSTTSGVAFLVNTPLTSAQIAAAVTGNFTGINPSAGGFETADVNVTTDTSAQVGVSSNTVSANNAVYITTYGWIDSRGRMA